MSDKPDKNLPFVVTDRRKFTTDGQPRPDADPSPEREIRPELRPQPSDTLQQARPEQKLAGTNLREARPEPMPGTPAASPTSGSAANESFANESPANEAAMPPAPTTEQMEQSRMAFQATADRLDVAIRSANPGADHPPAMSFEQVVQSVYMQAILQLGGGTEEGQQPQVDILGARQSIDMLGILNEKTKGNLSAVEQSLIDSALFELRLAFLEITQALARSAQQRNANPTGPGGPPPGRPGPSIVR